MRAVTWCSTCPWLTLQPTPHSTYMPIAGYDGPHGHVGFEELSTAKIFGYPSVIIMVFNTFVPATFGDLKSHF